MFPLSCARVRAHTGRKTRAHKKTWSAQKIIFPEMCCTYTSMCKNAYGQIIFCAFHILLLLLLMYISHMILLDQDLHRHLLSLIFVLNCQNVFDITILYIISETRVKKLAQPTPEIGH